MSKIPSIVFDCGSHHLRAGYGGEHAPRLDVPALVGRPRHRGVAMAAGMSELSAGEEALIRQGLLSTSHPVRDGLVKDWEEMEQLWSHVLYEDLKVNPEKHCFIATQGVNAPALQKEKTLELLMETFHVDSLYLGTSQVLSAYAYGLTTALVLDSGKDATLAVPVYEGYAMGRYVARSEVAGAVLTDYLSQMLTSEGYSLGTPVERELVNQAKEEHCYVRPSRAVRTAPAATATSGDFDASSSSSVLGHSKSGVRSAGAAAANNGDGDGGGSTTSSSSGGGGDYGGERLFQLPDGQAIPLYDHCHRTTEVLFDFSLLGDDARFEPPYKVLTDVFDIFQPSFRRGISWLPFAAISGCDAAIQSQLYANICIAGSTLSFPGLRDRLESEIIQLYRENHSSEAVMPISVKDIADARGYSAWLGGSILSRMGMFQHMAVSRAEYEESGSQVVHCKQF